MAWWLCVRMPGQTHLFEVGEADPEELAAYVAAARRLLGFPDGDNWPGAPSYDLSLAPGEPHADLLSQAVVHELAELEV
jgi:hypothetical protein